MRSGRAQAVLFDFGGTLDADGVRWAVRFHEAYLAEGGRLGLEGFESIFKESDRALEAAHSTRQMGFQVMVETQTGLVVQGCPDGDRVDARRIAARFCTGAIETVDRNRPVLERLSQRCRLGVVSNFTGNLDRCLTELGLSDLFGVVADSTVIGVAKPDPRIFTQALTALGATAGDSWMVGDNFETDIRPARALGLHTCWLTTADRSPPAETSPTARIARLTDLEAVFR